MAASREKAAADAGSEPRRRALTPARWTKFVRWQMTGRMAEICEALLQKAEGGDLAALKVLLEITGLNKAAVKSAGIARPLAKQMAFVRKTLAEFRQERGG
jgi:hypothetical protein